MESDAIQENTMPTDKALVSVYVPQDTKRQLEEWASEEDRSMSYLVNRLIAEALVVRKRSQIPPPITENDRKGTIKNE